MNETDPGLERSTDGSSSDVSQRPWQVVTSQTMSMPAGGVRWLQEPTFIGPGVSHRRLREAYRTPSALVVSYPRAGRTWVRAMLAHAFEHTMRSFSAHPMDTTGWTRIDPSLPRLILTHGRSNPRNKTPETLHTDHSWARDQRVLLLVRDPRDLMVSLWHERTHRLPLVRRRQAQGITLGELMRAEKGGLRTVVAYYNAWARQRDVPRELLLVKYEHLIEDAALECGRMLRWLGVQTAPGSVEEAVRAARFETLRRMEVSGRLGYKPSPALINNPDALIMRRGTIGGYKDAFTTDDHAYAREVIAGLDPWYGYGA
ncbi:MAG: hypothetical protein Tsb0013_07870 [Phycisphaerales bacterium]